MRRTVHIRLLLLVLLPLFVFVAVAGATSTTPVSYTTDFYPGHLDGAFTGGFGEQTCHTCHFDYDINNDRGRVTIDGIGEAYRSGQGYELTVIVESERLEVGGFQMTARFDDGSQAGQFAWDDERITLTPAASGEVQYVQHSAEGTAPTADRKVAWSLTWEAPQEDTQPVIFNIAANAGNDDDSAFGDWIYVKELVIEPGK